MTTKGLVACIVHEIRDDKDLDSGGSDTVWKTLRMSEMFMETVLHDLKILYMKATGEKNSRALAIVPSPILGVICCPHVVN